MKQLKQILKNSFFGPFYFSMKFFVSKFVDKTLYKFLPRNSKNVLYKFFSPPLYVQWFSILKNSHRPPKKNDDGLKIVFAPIWGFVDAPLAFESVVGKSLQMRGHDVASLSCNGALPACQWNTSGNNNPENIYPENLIFKSNALSRCKQCDRKIEKTCNSSGIKKLSLIEYEDSEEISDLEKIVENIDPKTPFFYKGININEHVTSSILRVELRGTMADDNRTIYLYKRFALSAIKLINNLERFIKEYKPDRFVCVHGIYLEHGILVSVANKNKVPIIVWGTPYRKNTVTLCHDDTYHREWIYEPNSIWENIILTKSMNEKLDLYANSKLIGGRDNVNYHPNPIIKKSNIYEKLNLKSDKPIVTLFTNVLWDAQIFYASNAFDNLLDWIFSSIEFYQNKETQLIVRIHPAESKGGFTTSQPIANEIFNKFPNLSNNIKIVEPESDISSYTLAEISNVNIVYGTNMALEIAIRGLPLMIVGECVSRGKGFSYDVNSSDEYFEMLNNIDLIKPLSDYQIQRARKYAYHLYFRKWVDFKKYSTAISGKQLTRYATLNFNTTDELLEKQDIGIDVICEGIVNQKPFLNR